MNGHPPIPPARRRLRPPAAHRSARRPEPAPGLDPGDGDHLTIAIIGAGELASHALQRRRQHPVLEGRTVAQRARLASQDRHVMPWIVNRLAPAIAAAMLCDDAPVLADDDPIGPRVGPQARPRTGLSMPIELSS